MFSIVSTLLAGKSGTLIKNLLGVLAIVALLFGIYEWGHGNGFQAGEIAQSKVDAPVIAKLTKTINDERQAVADKAQAVSASATDASVKAVKELSVVHDQRTQIVTKYIHDNPVQASECEISVQTISAINDQLALQQVYDVPDPNAAKVENTGPPPDVVPDTKPDAADEGVTK